MTNWIENSAEFAEWEYHEIRREGALKIGYEIVDGAFGVTLKHIESNELITVNTLRDAYDHLKQVLIDNPELKEKLK
jgi:hypothetical protein